VAFGVFVVIEVGDPGHAAVGGDGGFQPGGKLIDRRAGGLVLVEFEHENGIFFLQQHLFHLKLLGAVG